jgi:hypothetical protein
MQPGQLIPYNAIKSQLLELCFAVCYFILFSDFDDLYDDDDLQWSLSSASAIIPIACHNMYADFYIRIYLIIKTYVCSHVQVYIILKQILLVTYSLHCVLFSSFWKILYTSLWIWLGHKLSTSSLWTAYLCNAWQNFTVAFIHFLLQAAC